MKPTSELGNKSDEFKKVWADGGTPSLEDFLAGYPVASRPQLLTELLPVELWWRRKRGEQPELESYCSRFPELVEGVRDAFSSEPTVEFLAATMFHSESTEVTVRRKPEGQQYRILNEVARGGMGVIHRVWDESLGRFVAMKVIRGDGQWSSASAETSVYQRFVREAEITGQLDHPGVVPIHELGVDEDGRTYFTMRLIDGDNLHHIFQLVKNKQLSWNETRALGVIVNVCDTIAFAHSRNILHRDLKPANVMVGQFGETYVMDWGLAKAKDSAPEAAENRLRNNKHDDHSKPSNGDSQNETMDGSVLGTPAYMPPEQAAGQISNMDGRSDIYSIGAILYELLAGDTPYKDLNPPPTGLQLVYAVQSGPPTSLSVLRPKSSPELVAICEKAMARSPDDRYQSAKEMSEDLRAYLEGRVVRAHRTGPWVELKKWIGRNRTLATAMMSTVLIAVFGLAALVNQERSKNEQLQDANAKTTQQRNYAESLYFAQRSIDSVETDPALALLLAQESLQRDTNATSRTAFYKAIGPLDEKNTLIGHSNRVWRAEFSPDGTRVITASDDSTIALWDVNSGKRLANWTEHKHPVRAVAWSPDGKRFASADHSSVIVRDADTGNKKWTNSHSNRVWTLEFSADSSLLVLATSDENVVVFNANNGEPRKSYRTAGQPRVARFDPHGGQLATGTKEGTIHLHDLDSGNSRTLHHTEGGVELLQFSLTGDRLMSSDRSMGGRKVHVWNPKTGEEIAVLEHESKVTASAMTSDGLLVATGQENGSLTIWKVTDSTKLHVHEFGVQIPFIDIAADNQQLVACAGRMAHCVRLTESDSITTFKGHGNTVLRVRFNKDASLVLTCAEDQTARLWATGTHRLVPQLNLNQAGAPYVNFTQQGNLICWVKQGHSADLWSPGTSSIHSLPYSSGLLQSVLLRSDVLVTRCQDGVYFRRLADGSTLKWIPGGGNKTIVGSPNGESVLLIDRDSQQITQLASDGQVEKKYPLPPSAQQSENPFVWFETANGAIRVHRLQDDRIVDLRVQAGDMVLCSAEGIVATGPSVSGNSAQIWSTRSGDHVATLEDSSDPPLINSLLVADGSHLLASSIPASGRIRVWDARTGKRLPDLPVVAGQCRVSTHQDSRKAITIDDRAVRLWDLGSCRLDRVISNHLTPPAAFAWSADGQFVAIVGEEADTAKVWRLTDSEPWCILPTHGAPRFLGFGMSNELVVADAEGRYNFWRLNLHSTLVGSPRGFSALEAETLSIRTNGK